MSKSRRVEKVASLIRKEMSYLLSNGLRDQRISSSMISITDVEVSGDLQHCKIFVSIYDLIVMKFKDIFLNQKFYFKNNKTYNFDIICKNCRNSLFSLTKEKIYKCLVCGKNNS